MYAKLSTGPDDTAPLKDILSPLFRNNLFITGVTAVAGEGAYVDCFLCSGIDDEDLPWDVTKEPLY